MMDEYELLDGFDELGPEPTIAARVSAMRHMTSTFNALPNDTLRNREMKKKLAATWEAGWDKATDMAGPIIMDQFAKDFVTKWWSIGIHFSAEFKVDHWMPLTPEQLARGPAAGKQWYIQSTIFPFSLIPGVPYIHIPGIPVYPLFRIRRTPFLIVLKTADDLKR